MEVLDVSLCLFKGSIRLIVCDLNDRILWFGLGSSLLVPHLLSLKVIAKLGLMQRIHIQQIVFS